MTGCQRLLIALIGLLLFACSGQNMEEPVVGPTAEEDQEKVLSPAERIAEREQNEAGSNRQTVSVYYHHPIIEGIIPVEKMIFASDNPTDLIKQTIDHLSIEPGEDQGRPIWPPDTYVREVYTLQDGTVVVDFDQSFAEKIAVSILEEQLMVISLVNSILDSFPEYGHVAILIDGEMRETLAGHVDIEAPFSLMRNIYTIIPEQDLSDEIVVEDLDVETDKKPMN